MTVRRQRGVALIAAVLVVALATVLIAGLLDRGEATQARTRNLLRAEQGRELMRGLEGWATAALRQDFDAAPNIDHPGDVWAQGLPPVELPGVRLQGRLIERNGCFNLNNLHPNGQDDAIAIARMERLLRALRLDPAIAQQAVDWIDADAVPRQNGAEDSALLARSPPMRVANQSFVHVSELRLLPGVDASVYAVLAPEVCALPAGTTINLNFASEALWMSLSEAITPSLARQLAREGRASYESLDAVTQEMTRLGLAGVPMAGLGVGSDWFVLEAQITADGIAAVYSSLLQRRLEGSYVLARMQGRW